VLTPESEVTECEKGNLRCRLPGGKVDDTWRVHNREPNWKISKRSHSLIKKAPDCSRSFCWLESRPGFWNATRRRTRRSSVAEFHFPLLFAVHYGGCISWNLP
jgi:hypothetical protein